MRDPYEVLGVARTATADELKSAYRKLARAHHPDVNPNNPRAEEKFKEATAAYDLLSDEAKRKRFDRGEINANGQERTRPRGRHTAGAGTGGASGGGRAWNFDSMFGEDDLFSDIFARASKGPGGRQNTAPRKGPDANYRLHVTFEEAALGTSRTVSLTNGKRLTVKVPPGTDDESTLRLKGQGGPGTGGGPDGDALVEIKVKPHPILRREGTSVVADIPITLQEAVLGAKIEVPTVAGKVRVTVPKGANGGTVLRLPGKGIPAPDGTAGDQLVRLRLVLEDPTDGKLESFVKKWKPTGPNPRAKLGLE
ncbi:MAG: DnaJ C-terminal domain-containing protein [Rhodospirillaceae bacterium]